MKLAIAVIVAFLIFVAALAWSVNHDVRPVQCRINCPTVVT